jgi:hypothetical protein
MSPELTSLALVGESARRKSGAAAVAVCLVLLVVGCGGSGLNPAKVAQSFEDSRSVGVSDPIDNKPYVESCSKTSNHYYGKVVYSCLEYLGGPGGTMPDDYFYTFDKVHGQWEANPVGDRRPSSRART